MLHRFVTQWRASPPLTPLLVILLGVPGVFYHTTASMIEVWRSNETYTHGFLILPITVWLLWDARHRIATIPLRPDVWAATILLPALMVWLISSLIDVAVVAQFAMITIMQISVWLLLGRALASAIAFPLLYLFFAVPIGQSLIPPMMEFTADFTVYMVQVSGIPVFRDGLLFQLPSGNWSVVEECSGVRYLIASAALGTIYAYLNYQSTRKRLLFVLAALIVPILANGLRAYGIVMIGHFSGMQYAVGADHLLYGWVFFGLVIFVMFWLGGHWSETQEKPLDTYTSPTSSVATYERKDTAVAALLLSIYLVINLACDQLQSSTATQRQNISISIPKELNGFQRTTISSQSPSAEKLGEWAPSINNPDLYLTAKYSNGTASVVLHFAYFKTQRSGAEAVSSLNRLVDPYGSAWKLASSRGGSSLTRPLKESEVTYGNQKRLVWSGYGMGDRLVASPYVAKILQARNLLFGHHQAAYLTLSTPFDAPIGELRMRLQSIAAPLWPQLSKEMLSLAQED
ncbi:exosortase A [Congregibacter brevis]|uniref:Exosortase A n=1 Tax=Congregibacter brevis TaxID=3081201 RepID=A0ABZ0IGV5_9GAMM|nr:exosortase A [Congregibacter sp. IMCC45268]